MQAMTNRGREVMIRLVLSLAAAAVVLPGLYLLGRLEGQAPDRAAVEARAGLSEMQVAMAYALPEDQPVFVRNHIRPTRGTFHPMPEDRRLGSMALALEPPMVWVRLAQQLENRTIPPHTPVLFLHERRTPGGRPLLVALELEARFTGDGFYSPGPQLWAVARVIDPGDASAPPRVIHHDAKAMCLGSLQYSTVFAAQADSRDTAHFTFRIITAPSIRSKDISADRTIDGWLTPEGKLRFHPTHLSG
jgi:hypothetical protein